MKMVHNVPISAPRGRLPGQGRPERVFSSETPNEQLMRGWHVGQADGNVEARNFWVTDGTITTEDGRHDLVGYSGRVVVTDETWAYYVSEVRVGGELVAHPMVWAAWSRGDWARGRLMNNRLPMYRCMTFRGWRMMFANWHMFNGGWTYRPGDASWASAYPGRVEAPYLRQAYWYLQPSEWPVVDNSVTRAARELRDGQSEGPHRRRMIL